MTLLPLSSDPGTCPVCGVNHDRIEDELWSCPVHGHQLQWHSVTDADMNRYTCPAHRCKYERCAPRTHKENPMTDIAVRSTPTPITRIWEKEKQLDAVLPDHIDARAFIGTALAALYDSPALMKAAEDDPGSLISALMRCASLGHRPGTDEFYLTPRGGKVLGIEGYRGIIERMYRSGAVRNVVVREVCENDRFAYVEGLDERPVHRFGGTHNGQSGADFFGPKGSLDRGEMVGVYAYAVLDSGAISRVVILTRDDVMAAKEASDAGNSKYSPWNRLDGGKAHPEFTGRSMWWKTAARRLEPWVPTSAEYRRELARAEAAALPRDISGDLDAIPANRIEDAAEVDGDE
jgi:recombination protein RecT